MTATVEVPADVVERARKHIAKTGHPLLLRDRRRRNDHPLVALPGDIGYLVMLGPESPVAQAYVEMGELFPDRDLLADLAKLAVVVLEEMPRRFTCDGNVVGLWEIFPSEAGPSVCVRGPVALSLLSWTLCTQKVGVYLTLSEVPAGDDD